MAYQTTSESFSNAKKYEEGRITRKIENTTAKIPSVGYLGLAIGSIVTAVLVESFSKKKELGTFVGIWAPTFLLFGIYNKIVKLESELINKQ